MNIISLDWRYRNYLDLMSQLCGSDILAYDYCGYGFSTGRPSEENCYESIEARGGPGGGKDGGIIELDIWPVTWGYTQIYIYMQADGVKWGSPSWRHLLHRWGLAPRSKLVRQRSSF